MQKLDFKPERRKSSPAKTTTRIISSEDLWLFNRGSARKAYKWLGAHPLEIEGREGVHFAVWAPNAASVSVTGDFNEWNPESEQMKMLDKSGVWTCFVNGARKGDRYKYSIISQNGAVKSEKADPFAFAAELRPQTASVVCGLGNYQWQDWEWQQQKSQDLLKKPVSIYELHLGSWMRAGNDGKQFLNYREIAEKLIPYVRDMGFTHVELLPVCEHPLDQSWGYQPVGLFAPTSRFGSPDDFRYLIDSLHQAGIGVIMDWVPAHFPWRDAHGLANFDGSALYEYEDILEKEHPDWGTYVYNWKRFEVVSTLISNAIYWLDEFHIDGLRVDAVASMLYRDYSRPEGCWKANEYGGRENLEAIDFLRKLNEAVYATCPSATTIAEESTAWPSVSRPSYLGGLGFGFKWNMGWMNDALRFFRRDPIHRKFHLDEVRFFAMYKDSENFVYPLSHDEVVHGKGSLLDKMPGDGWQKFANLRTLFGYMWTVPGKKMLFMGGEFAQGKEWNCEQSLDWHLLGISQHQGVQKWVRDLNRVYRETKALHEGDSESWGFNWIDCNDAEQCVLSYLRISESGDPVLVCINLTPVPRNNYKVGVPQAGFWKEILNSDATIYGGSGMGNLGGITTTNEEAHGREYSLELTLPPLSVLLFEPCKERTLDLQPK